MKLYAEGRQRLWSHIWRRQEEKKKLGMIRHESQYEARQQLKRNRQERLEMQKKG